METKKVKTMKVGGGDYAKVNSRMLEFRTDNPNGKIDTKPEYVTIGEKTYIQFKATIVKDKSDETSAESSGHARLPEDNKQKTFEKCETIAVGRALAFLGYGADGEIASSEEMEEFEKYQEEKREEAIEDAKKAINKTKSLDELKKVWSTLGGELQQELQELKDIKKAEHESK